MGVDRYRVCELWAAGPDGKGSGSGYRLGDRLVLTARHVIAPAVAGPGGKLRVRPVGGAGWLPARVEWDNTDADAALVRIEDERWRAPAGESVLRWGELAGSDPVPCAAVGFPWAAARPDRMRDTAHVYGQLAPLGQLKQGRLDLDVASASPSAREGGSPWAGMSGAAVIADSHLVGVITVDPARYQDRLVAVPASGLLADPAFSDRLAEHGVPTEAAPVGAGWYLRLPDGQVVSLAPAYQPVSRRLRSPSTLLHPEHGLVPFLGRQMLLDQITGWPQGPDRPVLLATGGGGSGKTRLGREACVQMLVAGWDAGLADERRDGTPTDRLQRPTLLVVDDADLHTGLIAALVGYLRWDNAGPEVRLLLLARAAGAWWDRLVRQQELDGAYTVLDLDRHPVPPADRAEHFRRASTAFAAYRDPGVPTADVPPPAELDDPAYAEPLLIHIAALLRTVATPATSPPGPGQERAADSRSSASQPGLPVRRALLQALCERERNRWYQLGGHLSFNPDLPLADQVVALAALTAAGDQAGAMSLLAALPNQAEVTRIGAEALAAWAHRLYAGPGYWNPLRPDLLAEQHLADTAQLPALAARAARLAAGKPWEASVVTQLLAELTRGAPDQPEVRTALDELLAAALPRIVDLALAADHPDLADLASLALQLAPQPGLAAPLAGQMPERSVRLAALAATLASQQVTQDRADAPGGDPDATNRLAGSLNNMAGRLAELGQREEALAAMDEAVAIYRQLAATRPQEFVPNLAMSLNRQSICLAGLGRREEALAAGAEAVATYRGLAAARPDAFLPDLAWSLANQSVRLSELGRREEALAAIDAAVSIRRELAAAHPGVFLGHLATELVNQSQCLSELGRREEALAASAEAHAIYHELTVARPDAFLPDLAMSLGSQAARLADMGQREEAQAACAEAVATYRELAAARPQAFLPNLAAALNNQSGYLSDLGRWEEALAAIDAAVSIRRELAAGRPQAFLSDLAMSLINQSSRLANVGQREEAQAACAEAVATYRELAAARPQAFLPNLAAALNNHSRCLSDLGRWEEALAAIEQALAIYRGLVVSNPNAFLPTLATSLANQSRSLSELGRWEEALAASEEALAIYRDLASSRPDVFLPDLASSLNTQSGCLSELGRWEEALAAIEQALAIYRDLASSYPDVFLPHLATSLSNQSLFQSRVGRLEEALAASEEALTIYRDLASSRPDVFLPGLAISLNNQSNCLSELGRREEAVAALEEAVAACRELAAARPDVFRPDLAMYLTNLALCLSDMEQREGALAASEEALAICRELTVARPDVFLPNLAASLTNQSVTLFKLGRLEEALAASEEATGIYRELAAARPDVFLPNLAQTLANLGNLHGSLGRRTEADAARAEAAGILARDT